MSPSPSDSSSSDGEPSADEEFLLPLGPNEEESLPHGPDDSDKVPDARSMMEQLAALRTGDKDDRLDSVIDVLSKTLPSIPKTPVELGDEGEPEDVSYSANFRRLLKVIMSKFPPEEQTKEEKDNRSQVQKKTEELRPKPSKLILSPMVKCRIEAIDEILEKKQEATNPAPFLSLFLKAKGASSYFTGDVAAGSITPHLQTELDHMLEGLKKKNFKSSKVAFSFSELDILLKGLFRLIEMWSFLDWGLGALDDGLSAIKEKLTDQADISYAEEVQGYVTCLDKAIRHGTGETSHVYTNMILKKRDHVLSMVKKSLSDNKKAALRLSPVSSFKLFEEQSIKETCEDMRKVCETDLIVSAAVANLAQKPIPRVKVVQSSSPLNLPKGPVRKKNFRGDKAGGKSRSYIKRKPRGKDKPKASA